MLLLKCIVFCMILLKVRSTECPDLHPCLCTDTPFLSIDCSNVFLSRDVNFSKLKGLYINNFRLLNCNVSNTSVTRLEGLKINKVDMSENNIINKFHREMLSTIDDGLEEINLDGSNVDVDLLVVLRRFSNLTVLSLERTNLDIRHIPNELFNNFPNLKFLYLSNTLLSCGNGLTLFRNLKALKYLHLRNVSLDLRNYKCLKFLKKLDSLEYLDLANNVKTANQKPVGALFKSLKLTSLKSLNLGSNNIRIFQNNAFEGVEKLEILDISNNLLKTVPKAVTYTLKNLTRLNVSCNSISYISDNYFTNLTNLQYLNFHGNGIESFPGNTFRGLGQNLQILDLSKNKLIVGHFWVAALRPLLSLRELNISYNQIKHIQNDSFDSTPHLQLLDVSGNPFSFTDTMFSGIEASLKELYSKDIGMMKMPLIPLQTLTELNVLDLSYNEFTMLPRNVLHNVNAKNIYLQNMNISHISKDAFNGLKTTASIYLDNNNITSLAFLDDTTPCLFNMISLHSNPLVCDCDTLSISASGRVGELIGTCTNKKFLNTSLRNISIRDVKLIEACKGLNIVTGKCSRTGRFISNSSDSLWNRKTMWRLIRCLIFFALYL